MYDFLGLNGSGITALVPGPVLIAEIPRLKKEKNDLWKFGISGDTSKKEGEF